MQEPVVCNLVLMSSLSQAYAWVVVLQPVFWMVAASDIVTSSWRVCSDWLKETFVILISSGRIPMLRCPLHSAFTWRVQRWSNLSWSQILLRTGVVSISYCSLLVNEREKLIIDSSVCLPRHGRVWYCHPANYLQEWLLATIHRRGY